MRTNILPHQGRKVNHTEPDITGILHDEQLHDVGLVKLSLFNMKQSIDAVNALVLGSGLSIRLISDSFIDLMHNDISVLAYAHEEAEKRIAKAAFEVVKRLQHED